MVNDFPATCWNQRRMIRLHNNKGLSPKYPTLVIYENQAPTQHNTSPWTNMNNNTTNNKNKNKNYDRKFPTICVIKNKDTKQLNPQTPRFLPSR